MRRRLSSIFLIFIILFTVTGCSSLFKIKKGNTDFEYLDKGEVIKVIIQSTRDRGFRFAVTDPETIKELYSSLSGAVPAEEKSTMDPDYIFEFHILGQEPRKYSYVAGAQENQNTGNLYGEGKIYHLMDRIDNRIIMNLNAMRKPVNFKTAYYGSVLDAVKAMRADFPEGRVNLIISEDREIQKYQMSYEIAEFAQELSSRNVILNGEEGSEQTEAKIVTEGYKTDFYKGYLEVRDGVSKKTRKYYIISRYREDRWEISVSGTKPEGW